MAVTWNNDFPSFALKQMPLSAPFPQPWVQGNQSPKNRDFEEGKEKDQLREGSGIFVINN